MVIHSKRFLELVQIEAFCILPDLKDVKIYDFN